MNEGKMLRTNANEISKPICREAESKRCDNWRTVRCEGSKAEPEPLQLEITFWT